jgi:tRNA-2-methylthio-N6-dimethylallyladenosine synthase
MDMKRLYTLITFGCQMNIHDAERISGVLNQAGWTETPIVEEADAIILLTCCVRESAEQRLYGRLASLKPLKGLKPITIAVGGCLAQNEGQRLLQRAPHVDLVFGTHHYPHIASLLKKAEEEVTCVIGMDGVELASIPFHRKNPFRAWVTITHGCDNYCSYCIVPFVRGPEQSRPEIEVIDEVAFHVYENIREVVLLGQNVNSYRRKEEGKSSFAHLLHDLGDRFPNIWVRFTTSHPRDFDLETMHAIADIANVCEHVHLPLQAGSDRILKAMNRGYSSDEYLEKAFKLRRMIEGVSLTTDLIVGFPGECESDFQKTLEVVEECRFDSAFTFLYNPREGTESARMPDDVPAKIKQERLERLIGLTRRLTAESLRKEVGKEVLAIVNGLSRKNPQRWSARTRNNKLVHFPRTDEDLSGKFVRVFISSAGSWSLQGDLMEVIG